MADTGDFSRSITKIDRMQHLAAMPLDDAEASWEEHAAVRKIIIIYLQVVGLWDYVIDFAAATRGVPWAAENGTNEAHNEASDPKLARPRERVRRDHLASLHTRDDLLLWRGESPSAGALSSV